MTMQVLKNAIRKRPDGSGGTEIGWSSLSQYAACPHRWALAELLPHPRGGHGIGSRPGRALIVGTLVHAFLHGWYLSSPEEGDYITDAGFDKLSDEAKKYAPEDLSQTSMSARTTPLAEALDLCTRYSRECSLTGPDPDAHRFRIAFDEEGPLVEREFRVDLKWEGYYFTTRIDTIAWAVTDGVVDPSTIVIPEHKTCDVSKRAGTLADLALSGQFCGEYLAVQEDLGHPGKIIPVINMIQKRAAAKDLCRIWEPLNKTPRDLEKFRRDTVKLLKQMSADVSEYQALLKTGLHPLEAIELVFRGSPPRETCAGQGYKCFAYDLCISRSTGKGWLMGTEPRFSAEDAIAQPNGE